LHALDGPILATFGFAVSVYGMMIHLFADAITVAGVRPLLPLSDWRISLSRRFSLACTQHSHL
jgi:membrane-bound metal-dependent hydrolase YbcI (DUF457 family)